MFRKLLNWVLTSVTLTFDLWHALFAWTSLLSLVITRMTSNKAYLRDLIAATSLVILLKFDQNHQLFSPRDLEIWWMTSKNNRSLFYTTSSFVHHFKSIGQFKLKLQSGNAQFRSKSAIFCPVWLWNFMDDRAPLLYYIKLCASFQTHGWIQTVVTVRKNSIRVKIGKFFVPCDLEIWRMTLNKANLRDLIAETGLIILLTFDSNRRFFAHVTLKFDGWPR